MSECLHESRPHRPRHLGGLPAQGGLERTAFGDGGRAAAARHDHHALLLPRTARAATGPVELRPGPRRLRHAAVDERAAAGARRGWARLPPRGSARRPRATCETDASRPRPVAHGERRREVRRESDAGRAQRRRTRAGGSPAPHHHHVSDRAELTREGWASAPWRWKPPERRSLASGIARVGVRARNYPPIATTKDRGPATSLEVPLFIPGSEVEPCHRSRRTTPIPERRPSLENPRSLKTLHFTRP